MNERVPDLVLPPKARAHLDGVWNDTVQTWGSDQARTYLRALNRAFKTPARKPDVGRGYDEIYAGLRVYPSGKPLMLCLGTDKGIDIVRVLHERSLDEALIELPGEPVVAGLRTGVPKAVLATAQQEHIPK